MATESFTGKAARIKAKRIEQLSVEDQMIGQQLANFNGGDPEDAMMVQYLVTRRQDVRRKLEELRSDT